MFKKRKTAKADLNRAFTSDYLANFLSESYADFNEAMSTCSRYAEYGVGASTFFVSARYNPRIQAVETDPLWAKEVSSKVPNARVILANLGPVRKFGRPTSYKFRDSFHTYFSAPFENSFNPEVVLVDGRFRVACFLTALLQSQEGTQIFFDDYPYRERFHIVEEVLEPASVTDRVAKFVRPPDIDVDFANYFIDKFEFVMD